MILNMLLFKIQQLLIQPYNYDIKILSDVISEDVISKFS